MGIFRAATASYLLAGAAVVLLADVAYAQTDVAVSGSVVDGESGAPLASASVTMLGPDGRPVTGALTDGSGRFQILGLGAGSYSIEISLAGHERKEIPLLIGERNDIYHIGTVTLDRSGSTIEELVVSAEGRRDVSIEPGINVFDMSDNIARAGGSVLDALRGLPGVTVDQEGRVLLRGSDKVAILMDGKQSSLTGYGRQSGLDSIPANNIERVEIINNPSARYDASGMAGVINIVYSKEKELGLHGDVGLSLGLGRLSKRLDDLPTDLGSFSSNPSAIPSLNLNYNTSSVHAYAAAEAFVRRHLPNNEFTTRFYDDGREIRSQVPENRRQTQYIVKGGLDWKIDANDTLDVSAIYDFERHTDRAEVPFIDAASMNRLRYWFWTENEVTGFLNFRTGFTHRFGAAGHELKIGLQYTRGWEDESYFLNEDSAIRIGSDETHLRAREHTIPLTVDYVRPMKSGRLELGTKVQIRWLPIDYDVVRGLNSVIYPGLGDSSEWSENIYAAYANLVYEKESYAVEAGVRMEQTEVAYDLPPENIYYPSSDSYDYFRVFPNVRLTYKIGMSTDASIFYNRRIDRPGEAELRIFPKYDDPELLKVGNPYLRPQDTQSIEFAIKTGWRSSTVSAALYRRAIDDTFLRVFTIDSSSPSYDIVNRIYANVGRAMNSGVELLMTQKLSGRAELSGSFNWYRIDIDAFETLLLFPTPRPFAISESKTDTWNAKMNGTLFLPGGIEMQLGFVYYAKKAIPQGAESARSSFDIGFSKALFDDKAEITLSATDLFNDFGIEQTIEGNGFTAIYRNFYETQRISLEARYKF